MALIVMKRGEVPDAWCVYQVLDEQDVCRFIAVTRLRSVFQLKGPCELAAFNAAFPHDAVIKIEILATYPGPTAAHKDAFARIRQVRPSLNTCFAMGMQNHIRSPVRCITTGELFPNADAACRKHGIRNSLMSMHLNGKHNYSKLNGLQFERVFNHDQ